MAEVGTGKDDRKAFGQFAEGLAADYLVKRGYTILGRNVRLRMGELDIVALHQGELVFCEVKARRSDLFGSPADAIDYRKQHKLSMLAECYQQIHPQWRNHACRFDAILITRQGSSWQVEVVQNAFGF
ncbi:MAG: YraN family protein [Magnetococcales bacterium]|nr:YraN family protein [Magnetococcales bacterium]